MNLEQILSGKKTVGITGHVRPDGDCIGSSLALYHYIRRNYPGIEADLYLEDNGRAFDYLKGLDVIKHEPDNSRHYDVFFALDCGNADRIKPFISMYDDADERVCIDHHMSTGNDFATHTHVLPASSSTCEVLYGLFDKDKIDKDIAECLYTGLIHDTGVFKYQATSPETMRMAAHLMEFGFDFTSIIDDSFYARTYRAAKALGLVLSKSELFLDGYGIYSILTPEEMKEIGVTGAEIGGVVEQLRLTDGVELAVFIYPGEGEKKISLRSKKELDVCALATSMGGGGHERAAGFSSYKGYNEIMDVIEKYAKEHRKG